MFLLLMLATIGFVMLYLKFKYFTLRRHLPGLSPQFLVGNLMDSGVLTRGVSLPQVYTSFKNRFGDIFQIWLGFSHFIVVSEVNDIQHIFTHRNIYDQSDWIVEQFGVLLPNSLFSIKGSKFKRHGALTIPLFRRAKIISNFDLIVHCTEKLLDNWRVSPSQKVHLDIVQQSQNLVLEIFGRIGFDYDFQTLSLTNKNELTAALKDFLKTVDIALYSPRIILTAYLRLSPRYRRAYTTIRKHIYRMIEQELAQHPESRAYRKTTSLIASLVGSLQTDEKAEASKSEDEKKGLSQNEVFYEMLAFLVAGFETTSTALAWAIHLLSKHPRVQQKIQAELLSNNVHRDLALDHLDSLVYLDCVIKEILRFSPPVDAVLRTLTVDDRLPKSGTQLFKGEQVLISLHSLARDSRYWLIDPDLFYPERFMSEDKNHHPFAFLPFGSGHRQCIGQDLARFELKVIVAILMQHITLGDGGPDVNAGGHLTSLAILPKQVGVTIEFNP